MLQQNQPVAYASHAMSSSEINYAQIEKELLAIVYRCERFNKYTYGAEIEVLSDHKPLESIFKKPLFRVPPRLQRMRLVLVPQVCHDIPELLEKRQAKYKEFYDRQGSKQDRKSVV